jgi:hypothetical protein
VSILIATKDAVGRWRGWQPASKVSMTIMRPPQQGHAWAFVDGLPGGPAVRTGRDLAAIKFELGRAAGVGTTTPPPLQRGQHNPGAE